MSETRTTQILFRTFVPLKAAAQNRAAEEGRSLSNYIEHLIEEDIKRAKEKSSRS